MVSGVRMNPCRFVHRISFRKLDSCSAFVSRINSCPCPNMTHSSFYFYSPVGMQMCVATLASARSSSSLARSFVIPSFLVNLHCAISIPPTYYSRGNGRLISAYKQTPSSYEIENRLCRVQEETCQGM